MTANRPRQAAAQQVPLVGPFDHDAGYAYRAQLSRGPWFQELAELGDSNDAPQRSPAVLLENGNPIGRAHASHRDIANRGGGLYSHWSTTVYFSASDNSDPNQNGCSYSLLIDRDFQRDERLASAVTRYLQTRLAALGPTESGFYNYYARLAESGTPFQFYDKPVARFVLDHASNFDRYVEIGAGIGQLSALLAAGGLHAVAVEGDSQRAKAAVALHDALAPRIDGIADNMSVVETFFPSNAVKIDQGTLVIFTNLIHSNDEDALLAGCRNAGGIVIDICRFGHSRTTTDLWRALIRQIRGLGFPYVDQVLSWGEPKTTNEDSPTCGRILYFHRGPQLTRRTATIDARRNAAPNPLTAAMVEWKPEMDFSARTEEVAASLASNPRALEIFRRTINSLDVDAVNSLKATYSSALDNYDPNGMYKYLDIPYWVGHKVNYAIMLDLDRRPPSALLDIGTGAAHLLAIANALGHRTIGIDIHEPFYIDVCAALNIDRRTCRVSARTLLPSLGSRFDIVTALWTVFNYIIDNPDGYSTYWSQEDWAFFLTDIQENHLNTPGTVMLEINAERMPDGSRKFNDELFSWLRAKGGIGEEGRFLFLTNNEGKII